MVKRRRVGKVTDVDFDSLQDDFQTVANLFEQVFDLAEDEDEGEGADDSPLLAELDKTSIDNDLEAVYDALSSAKKAADDLNAAAYDIQLAVEYMLDEYTGILESRDMLGYNYLDSIKTLTEAVDELELFQRYLSF